MLRGKRALVTGASSGIGAEIAKLLAAEGVDLVLAARRKDALDRVAAECKGVRTDVIVADLGKAGGAAALWQAAGAVNILINNAGFGYFRAFADADWARDAEMLQLNITSLVELSRRFVESRQGKTERAYLVNIASIAAYQSTPNFAVYTSSKAFVRNFTEALHDEFAGTPVSVTCISPGGTHTAFHEQAGAGNYSWLATKSMLSAEKVARISVDAMKKGKRNVIPGLLNKISCFGVRFVPRWFASWMSRRVLGKPRAGALPERTGTAA